jgi:hypothetical protein
MLDSVESGLEVTEVRPAAREPHDDAAGADHELRRDLDQSRAPGVGVAFAERVALAAVVEPAAAVTPSPYTTVKRTRSLWAKIRKCFWGLRFAISSPVRCRSQAEPVPELFRVW